MADADTYPDRRQDTVVNRNGKLLIDFCKESGLRIMNGRIGEYTGVEKDTFIDYQAKVSYVMS